MRCTVALLFSTRYFGLDDFTNVFEINYRNKYAPFPYKNDLATIKWKVSALMCHLRHVAVGCTKLNMDYADKFPFLISIIHRILGLEGAAYRFIWVFDVFVPSLVQLLFMKLHEWNPASIFERFISNGRTADACLFSMVDVVDYTQVNRTRRPIYRSL